MNSLIAHLPAGNLDIVDWRRLRTAARELNDLNLADLRLGSIACFTAAMIGIESAVETDASLEFRPPELFSPLAPLPDNRDRLAFRSRQLSLPARPAEGNST